MMVQYCCGSGSTVVITSLIMHTILEINSVLYYKDLFYCILCCFPSCLITICAYVVSRMRVKKLYLSCGDRWRLFLRTYLISCLLTRLPLRRLQSEFLLCGRFHISETFLSVSLPPALFDNGFNVCKFCVFLNLKLFSHVDVVTIIFFFLTLYIIVN